MFFQGDAKIALKNVEWCYFWWGGSLTWSQEMGYSWMLHDYVTVVFCLLLACFKYRDSFATSLSSCWQCPLLWLPEIVDACVADAKRRVDKNAKGNGRSWEWCWITLERAKNKTYEIQGCMHAPFTLFKPWRPRVRFLERWLSLTQD